VHFQPFAELHILELIKETLCTLVNSYKISNIKLIFKTMIYEINMNGISLESLRNRYNMSGLTSVHVQYVVSQNMIGW
jgi:hypothetical protein